mgnify:CR=1 FL=1
MRIFLMTLTALLTVFVAVTSWAEDKDDKKGDTPAAVKVDNPHLVKVEDMAKALAESLNEEQSEALGLIRLSFGMVRSVSVVRDNVGDAVKKCGDDNEDMKDDLSARHKAWDDNIAPLIAKNEKLLSGALSKDRFGDHAGKVEAYLDELDKAAIHAEEKLDKQIVTTPEACTHLLESMDETEATLVALLDDITWPEDGAPETEESAAP